MFFILLALWLIYSGEISLHTVLTGVVVSGLISLFCRKFMSFGGTKLLSSAKGFGRLLLYLAFLLKEIFISGIMVMKTVYGRREPKPRLVYFKSGLTTEGATVLVANSITLTPGTFTAIAKDGLYCVHALDTSFAEGIEHCKFLSKARSIEEA